MLTAPRATVLLGLALACYLASWYPVAFYSGGGGPTGLSCVSFGWMGLPAGYVSWLANPLFIASAIALRRANTSSARIAAGLAMVFALSFFAQRTFMVNTGAKGNQPITGYGPGFWLWLAAMGLQLAAAMAGAKAAAVTSPPRTPA